ncbi:MAG: hypothetical protein QW140_02410 [Candidatus Aenigmatarchaeota archaeon]
MRSDTLFTKLLNLDGIISIYLRNKLLYNGAGDLDKIKGELKNSRMLNSVEISALLSLLESESEAKKYLIGKPSPIDKLIFSLAYEDLKNFKERMEKLSNDSDFEKLIRLLEKIIEELPYPLRMPMYMKLEPYKQKMNECEEIPLIKNKKRKKKRELIYA